MSKPCGYDALAVGTRYRETLHTVCTEAVLLRAQSLQCAVARPDVLEALRVAVGLVANQLRALGVKTREDSNELNCRLQTVGTNIQNLRTKISDDEQMPITASRAFISSPKEHGP